MCMNDHQRKADFTARMIEDLTVKIMYVGIIATLALVLAVLAISFG